MIHSIGLFLLKIYWKLAKPKTFGVKVVIRHPNAQSRAIALIRNTYGRKDIWTLPGGGYKPSKESSTAAAAREVQEELGLTVAQVMVVGEYKTEAQGKQDTVTFVTCSAESESLCLSAEIAQAIWCHPNDIGTKYKVYDVTLCAVEAANDG